MNHKDKKRYKDKEVKRKVHLQYEDKRERLTIIKIAYKRKETLKIKLQSNSRDVIARIPRKEKYPIFRAQLIKRIVPCCLRDKCRRGKDINRSKTSHYKCNTQRKINDRSLKKRGTTSPIVISDDETDVFHYGNISSGTLSPYIDDKLEALMESTRKRMRASDEEWKLIPRHKNSTKTITSKSPSLNSLDTLVLDAGDEHLKMHSINNSKKVKLEPLETNNNKIKYAKNYDSRPDGNSKAAIEAVISKLERNDIEHLDLNIDSIDIKQELYSDI